MNCQKNACKNFLVLNKHDKEEVYKKALKYWTSVSSDINGMLGGFEKLHDPDVKTSIQFLSNLKKSNVLLNKERALDCGCGIGRVSKHVLLPFFNQVDMVDFAENFLIKSQIYIGEKFFHKVGNQYVKSLHLFHPKINYYDVIWIQWVTGQLTDKHFVNFLQRCRIALRKGGCIVIKDNITSNISKNFDTEDQSWTRTRSEFLSIFKQAELEVVSDCQQLNFPKEIYEVRLFGLKSFSQHMPTKSNN